MKTYQILNTLVLSVAALAVCAHADDKAPAKKSSKKTAVAVPAVREIKMTVEKVGDATHWMPEVVEVKPGEKLHFVLDYKLIGGMEFHGFEIKELKITQKVDRNKTMTVDAEVPADLKPGEYVIGCQFHPKHVPAKLVVKSL